MTEVTRYIDAAASWWEWYWGPQTSLLPPAWFTSWQRRDEKPRDIAWRDVRNGRSSGRHWRNGARIPGGLSAI